MLKSAFRGSLNPVSVYKTIRYKVKFMFDNPNYFKPCGVLCYCGEQGSGKTYSSVVYVYDLLKVYPRLICCTNMQLYGLFDEFVDRIVPYTGVESFTDVNNGSNGVIFLIDELHLEFNSLESKKMPLSLFTQISQQRKQRKHIVGTSQLYSRLAKPFREQMDSVVACKCFFGVIQFNHVMDGWTLRQDEGRLSGKCVKQYFLVHKPEFYESFDTYAVINRKKGDELL